MAFRLLAVLWSALVMFGASATSAFASGEVERSWVAAESFSFEALRGGTVGNPINADTLAAKMRAAEEEHEQAISTPAAEAERQDSVDAFTGLGRNAATALITDVFSEALELFTTLPSDPLLTSEGTPEFLADSDTSARIDPPGSEESQLVVSSLPLRNEDGLVISGKLKDNQEGFAPEAPLANVELPADADGTVALPDVAVGFSFAGVNASTGQLVDAGDAPGKEMVLYPNTQTDTDTAVTYTLQGVETFNFLRSGESPESLSLDYELPNGADLQSTADGGAVVLDSEGAPLVTVFPPFAVDAQGTDVPMTLSVEGSSISLNVPHRGKDFAYPIMVDPIQHVRDWWTNGSSADFQGWAFHQDGTSNYANSLTCPSMLATVDPCGGTGAGLYVGAVPGKSYPANSKGYWRWTIPGGPSSSIASAVLDSWRYRKGNSNAGWAFYNVYNTNGSSNGQNITAGGGGSNLYMYGGNSGWKYIHAGLMTNTANTIPSGASNYRYNRVAAYTASLTDGEAPTLSLGAAPAAWLGPNTPFNVQATAQDPGLGLYMIQANVNNNWPSKWFGWCLGTYPLPCPTSTVNQSMSFNSNDLPSGVNTVPVRASDVINGAGHQTQKGFVVKVDKSPPQVTASGGLLKERTPGNKLVVQVRDNTLNNPVYNSNGDLNMSLTTNDNPKLESGAKNVRLQVDGNQVGYAERACTATVGSCRLGPLEIELDLDQFSEGSHTLTLEAKDQTLNDSAPQTWTKIVDKTAPTVTEVSAPAGWLSGDSADVSVQASDAGYGVQKIKVAADGELIGEKDLDCGSAAACDTSVNEVVPVDLTELPEGPNELVVTAEDSTGRKSSGVSKQLLIDRESVEVEAIEVPDWVNEDGTFSIDATNPGSGIENAVLAANGSPVAEITNDCTAGCPENLVGTTEFDISAVTGATGDDVNFSIAVNAPASSRSATLNREGRFDRTAPTGSIAGTIFGPSTTPFGAINEIGVEGSDQGSGLAEVQILLDGEAADEIDAAEIENFEPTCSDGTCDFEAVLQAAIGGVYEPGQFEVAVKVLDAAGNSFSRQVEVELDPSPPSIELTGELAESGGVLPSNGVSELEVHAQDGVNDDDSGLRRVILKVDGNVIASSCEPENCVSTPDEVVVPYEFDRDEWGSPPYTLEATAVDESGNIARAELLVDPPTIDPNESSCGSPESLYQGSSQSTPRSTFNSIAAIAPEVADETEPYQYGDDSSAAPELVQRPTEDGYAIVGTPDAGAVDIDGEGVLDLGKGICLYPSMWNENATASQVSDDAILTENSRPGTSTLVQPGFSGATVVEYVENASALEGVSWSPHLGEDQAATELPSGDVAIVDTTRPAPERLLDDVDDSGQPSDAEVVESLASTEAQSGVSDKKMLDAAMNSSDSVEAVISKPVVLDANGDHVDVDVSVTGSGEISFEVLPQTIFPILIVIQGFRSPDPIALCEDTFAVDAAARAEICGPMSAEPLQEHSDLFTIPSYDLLGATEGDTGTDPGLDDDLTDDQLLSELGWDRITNAGVGSKFFWKYTTGQVCQVVGKSVCNLFIGDGAQAFAWRHYLYKNALGDYVDNTWANAFQHTLWTALMTKTAIGQGKKAVWGWRYAVGYEGYGDLSLDDAVRKSAKMDITNDYVGFFIGRNNHTHNEIAICTYSFERSWNARFIKRRPEPKIINKRKMVYRLKRSKNGKGDLVTPDKSRKCG